MLLLEISIVSPELPELRWMPPELRPGTQLVKLHPPCLHKNLTHCRQQLESGVSVIDRTPQVSSAVLGPDSLRQAKDVPDG